MDSFEVRNKVKVERMSITQTRADRDLLLTFFLTFARFEYALKASGLFKRDNRQRNPLRPREAEPDWDTFAVSLRDLFQIQKSEPLQNACEFILTCPPWKQVVINNVIDWETPVRPQEESNIKFILRMIRCIRNNLFHGGKHSFDVHEDTPRT